MTGPYPPPQNDGSWQPPQDPTAGSWQQQPQDPSSAGSSYELYPQSGGWPDQNPQPVTGVPASGQPYGPPQPVSGQPYGPPQPAYAPPPPGGYPPPTGQFMPPGPPQAPSSSNKGWIFGGIAVGAVILLLVIGFIVVNAMNKKDDNAGSSNSNSSSQGTDGKKDDGKDDKPAASGYKSVPDICTTFTESDYSASGLKQQKAPSSSSNDSGYSKDMRCTVDLEGKDYNLGTLDVEATLYEDQSSVSTGFDSMVSIYASSGTATDHPGFGEKAKLVFDPSIGPTAYLFVQDKNMVLMVRIFTTDDKAANSKLQTTVETVTKKVMSALAA